MSWPSVAITEVARIVSGATPSTSNPVFWDGEISWVTPKDLSDLKGAKFLNGTPRKLTAEGLRACSAELLPANSVLFSSRAPIGLVAINTIPVATNQGFKSFLPDSSRLDAGYLYHWIRTNRPMLERLGVGATFKEVSKAIVARVKLPLPPLEEQRRIAALLDKAEELRAQRRATLALLDHLPQAIFLEMFGDPVSNPKEWPIKPFSKLGRNEDSKRRPIKSSDRATRQGPFPYYGASGIIDSFDDFIFDGARLLIGEDGANLIARSSPIAFIATGRYWVNNHAHVIAEADCASLEFLEQFLLCIDLEPYVSGSAQPKLTRASLDGIDVPTPPIELQRQFSAGIEAINHTREAHQSALTELTTLFNSLQAQAFGRAMTLPTEPHRGDMRQELTTSS